MRKIDKSGVLSTVYKQWLDNLEQTQKSHGRYSSSKRKFYKDIVMNLYHCQKGLCAYTERRLCEDKHFDAASWSLGKYTTETPDTEGQLDHFDPDLKKNKSWLWDNLFMVLGKANNGKGSKIVDDILKPDTADYDPFKLLYYDYEFDLFRPNETLGPLEEQRVQYMISTLCINADYVKLHRKPFLRKIKAQIELGKMMTWEDAEEPKQFPTAFEMLRREQALNQ